MAFEKLCELDDLWEGEMESFEIRGVEILVVWPTDGEIIAYQGLCPHQDIPLAEGKFDGKTLICRAHSWTFDGCSGVGINPSDCCLARYPIKVVGNDVLVDIDGVKPMFAHS
ncbi:MAG: 2Fe-2S ferredoxin [Nevskiaceae bacterium]|nr:MAG: 2Fe-2S ferredoxin [Nevskiaceae bacterium]TBR71961.1 MAG: 2Fe-2S ferredoxin [Nevskiaceae bacterium]